PKSTHDRPSSLVRSRTLDRSRATSAALGRDGGRALELLRSVDVHEGDRRIAEGGDLGLEDLDDAHALEEAGDLEPPCDQALLDVRHARLRVCRVHRLVLSADAWNDHVALARARDHEADDLGMQEG